MYEQRFCSQACYQAFQKTLKTTMICLECGAEFNAPPSWGKKFCSRICSGASLSRRYKGIKPSPQCVKASAEAASKRLKDPEIQAKMQAGVRKYQETHPGPWEDAYGALNPNWKGGIAYEPYSADFNEHLKEQIRQRDGFQCQLCGITQDEHIQQHNKRLAIHHIDYDKKNSKPSNLITLCIACNSRANGRREYHQQLFTDYNECKAPP